MLDITFWQPVSVLAGIASHIQIEEPLTPQPNHRLLHRYRVKTHSNPSLTTLSTAKTLDRHCRQHACCHIPIRICRSHHTHPAMTAITTGSNVLWRSQPHRHPCYRTCHHIRGHMNASSVEHARPPLLVSMPLLELRLKHALLPPCRPWPHSPSVHICCCLDARCRRPHAAPSFCGTAIGPAATPAYAGLRARRTSTMRHELITWLHKLACTFICTAACGCFEAALGSMRQLHASCLAP